MKLSHATVALSVIKGSVSIHRAVEFVEIPNTNSQMTNKDQLPKSHITNQYPRTRWVLRHFRHFPFVLVISISNLRFVWNLMLGIWDFKDSVNDYSFFLDQTGRLGGQKWR